VPRPGDAELVTAALDRSPVLTPDPLDIRVSLGAVVHWADSPTFRRRLMEAVAFPLDDVQAFLAVNQLAYRGALRPTDLADAVQTGRSNISKIARRLAHADLAVRTADPGDDRGVLITLTPLGREVGRRIMAANADLVHEAVRGWDPAEVATFASLLARFSATIGSAVVARE
jgi:DNA-binding MarR family transcriptional regulator